MGEVVYVAFLGLGLGALYAVLGQSVIVAHLGSGIVNFAVGAVAMYSALQYSELRRNGDLVLPLVDVVPGDLDLPVRLSLSDGRLGFWPAYLGAMAVAVLLGLAVHVLVARPLRAARPAAKVAGTVAVLLYLLGVAGLSTHFGTPGRALSSVLPGGVIEDFLASGNALPTEVIVAAAIAGAFGVGLWVVYSSTRFGLATRAAAASPKGAELLGHSPGRLGAAGWVLASVLAGSAGVVLGSLAGPLSTASATVWLVPALAAAMLGGLTSVGWATVGGLAIGVAQGVVGHIAGRDDHDWFPDAVRFGLPDVVPLAVIVVVLLARRGSMEATRTLLRDRRPALAPVPRPERIVAWCIVGPVVALLACLVLSDTWELALVTSLVSAILLLSFVVLTGYVGEVSLAQLALAGVTAFVLLRLLSDGPSDPAGRFAFPSWPLVAALPVAVAAAAAVGVLAGLPAVRGRSVELAVVTVAVALALERWYFESPALTGVSRGAVDELGPVQLFGVDAGNGEGDRLVFAAFVIALLVVCSLVVVNLRRTGTGRRFLAVRADAEAAAAVGVDVPRLKLLAFGIASALAGVAGGLFAIQHGEVGSSTWTGVGGLALLAFAVIGGVTSVAGALVGGGLVAGGLALTFVAFHVEGFDQHTLVLAGAGMLAVTVLRPSGLVAMVHPACDRAVRCIITWRGPQWARAFFRYTPWLVVGAIVGWVVWTRHDGPTWWMVLVGAALALVVRWMLETAVRLVRKAARARRSRPRDAPRLPLAAWPPPVPVARNGSAPVVPRPWPALSLPSPRSAQPALARRPLLQVSGLTVRFGTVTALADAAMVVGEGAVAGLIGPNGAGKSTFVDAICGRAATVEGTVSLDGQVLDKLSMSGRAQLGLVRTFATPALFDDLTVRDNLMVAADRARWWSALADIAHPGRRSRATEAHADWAIGALELEDVADEVVTRLPHSRRKLVGVARALATRPRLLVLDEPAAGLDPAHRQVLAVCLRDLPARGTTVLLVDRDLGLAQAVCEVVHVLDVGMVIATGSPEEVRDHPAFLRAYGGSEPGGLPEPLLPRPVLPHPSLPPMAWTAPIAHAAADAR